MSKIQHVGTQELCTQRLVLRRFELTDAEAMYANWASREQATHYLTWVPHTALEVTQQSLAQWIKAYAKADYYHWAIALQTHPENVIGDIVASMYNTQEGLETCEIGYVLQPEEWAKGYMTEALQAVNDFLLKEVGLHRVIARHDVANPGSGRVMHKAGMQFEGIERQAGKNNTGIVDVARYAILQADICQ